MTATYYVGFSRRLNSLAKLIMLFTRSSVSHGYVRVDYGDAHSYVLEASDGGVDIKWLPEWRAKGHAVVAEYQVMHPGLHEAWVKVCDDRVGRPYGWLQLVGDAYVIARQALTKKRVRNPFGLPWADVCSELQLGWLRASGVAEFRELDPETVTAADLYVRISALMESGDRRFNLSVREN